MNNGHFRKYIHFITIIIGVSLSSLSYSVTKTESSASSWFDFSSFWSHLRSSFSSSSQIYMPAINIRNLSRNYNPNFKTDVHTFQDFYKKHSQLVSENMPTLQEYRTDVLQVMKTSLNRYEVLFYKTDPGLSDLMKIEYTQDDIIRDPLFVHKITEMWGAIIAAVSEEVLRDDPTVLKVEFEDGSSIRDFKKRGQLPYVIVFKHFNEEFGRYSNNSHSMIEEMVSTGHIPLPIYSDEGEDSTQISRYFHSKEMLKNLFMGISPISIGSSIESLSERNDHPLHFILLANDLFLMSHDISHSDLVNSVAVRYLTQYFNHAGAIENRKCFESISPDNLLVLYFLFHENPTPLLTKSLTSTSLSTNMDFALERFMEKEGFSLNQILGDQIEDQRKSCFYIGVHDQDEKLSRFLNPLISKEAAFTGLNHLWNHSKNDIDFWEKWSPKGVRSSISKYLLESLKVKCYRVQHHNLKPDNEDRESTEGLEILKKNIAKMNERDFSKAFGKRLTKHFKSLNSVWGQLHHNPACKGFFE